MSDKKILKAFLNYEFYKKYKNNVVSTMFSDTFLHLYKVIETAHSKYQKDLTEDDVYDLYCMYNPIVTEAKKVVHLQYLNEIKNIEQPTYEIMEDLVQSAYKKEMGRQIGVAAFQLMQGIDEVIPDLAKKVEILQTNSKFGEENIIEVSNDLTDLLKDLDKVVQYDFNITNLANAVNGIGEGTLTIIGARPEVGKTLFWLHLCMAPGGFLHQGAKITAFCNEEPGVRIKLRAYSALTGFPAKDFKDNLQQIQELYNPYKENFNVYDAVAITMNQIEAFIQQHSPNIVIVDQADKITIDGTYTRGDERLRELYIQLRELAKKYKCAVVAISQLSAEAEGKLNIALDMFENSRTGKAAEGDLIIGIGKRNDESGELIRQINVLKNKISGIHSKMFVTVNLELSRYAE